LQGRLAHRVNGSSLKGHPFSVATADVDNASALVHVLDGSLRRDKHGPHIDGDRAVKVRQLEIVNRAKRQHARAIDEDVYATQFSHRAIDSTDHGTRVGAVGLNGNHFASERLRRFGGFIGSVGRARIGESDMCAFRRQTIDNGGTDAATPSGDECAFIFECLVHKVFGLYKLRTDSLQVRRVLSLTRHSQSLQLPVCQVEYSAAGHVIGGSMLYPSVAERWLKGSTNFQADDHKGHPKKHEHGWPNDPQQADGPLHHHG
jgi:hypothetical protein